MQIINREASGKLEQAYDYNMNKKLRVCDLTRLLVLPEREKCGSKGMLFECYSKEEIMRKHIRLNLNLAQLQSIALRSTKLEDRIEFSYIQPFKL